MMQTIHIEPFFIERYDQVYALWQRSSGAWLSSADECEHITRYLARNPGMSFLAFAGDTVVGTILGGHDGRRGYIHHLAVDDAYRRKGIGGQLVERCLAALEEEGLQKVHLFVFHENEDGIDFWKANGWELRRDIMVMSKHIEGQAL
jgi:ribosomal protein S18 acetylase RimI-like enzyme